MKTVINNIQFECTKGNIVEQNDIVAIVNAANARLKSGGGVAGAIHDAAGPELEKECQKYAPIKTGEAVITKAYKLPNNYVIHTLGPVYGVDKPEDRLLSLCYKNSLYVGEKNSITSIAFPAISTGIFGFPIYDASKVAVKTILKIIPFLKNIKHIRFVLFSDDDLNVYSEIINKMVNENYG